MKAPLQFPRPAKCPANLNELIDVLERGTANVPSTLLNFGPNEPGEDGRAYPWIKTDANRNPIGTFVYSSNVGKWLRDWGVPVGTLRTIYRSAATVSADREDKGLIDGWELADGTGLSSLDMTTNKAFFTGSSPNWDVYTLLYTGQST